VSDSASPQRWGEEHMIDLGALGEPAPVPDPAPSPTRRLPRIPNAALAYAAVAVALAAAVVTVVKWSPLHRPLAESTVADFLQAVHDGDVEGALALTDQEDAEGPFLVPEALDSRWEITKVAQVAYEENDSGHANAQVYAEIEDRDGNRIGHRYHVVIDRGEARIQGAMDESEAWGSLDYLDLNGVSIEIDMEEGPNYVLLLPGYYEFYPDLPSTMEFEGGSTMLALGNKFLSIEDGYIDTWMPSPWLMVSREGEDAVNAALREFYDACAADPSGEGCPFVFPEDPDRELALAQGARWEVASYPEVSADRLWYEYAVGFTLESSRSGEVRAQVEITEDGATRTALVSCPFTANGLYAAFDDEGGFVIDPSGDLSQDHCEAVVEVDA
jgi:hypothetical protein